MLWEMPEKQVEPHVISYSAAILAVAGQWEQVMQIVNAIWRHGVGPEVHELYCHLTVAEWRHDAIHEVVSLDWIGDADEGPQS